MAHMVDDERHLEVGEQPHPLGHLTRIGQELQVPAHLAAERIIARHVIEADPAAVKIVEAEPDDAGLFHRPIDAVRLAEADDANPTQARPIGRQGFHHQPVVDAVDANLDENAIAHAGRIQHGKIARRRRLRRRIASSIDERIVGREANHMGVRVDRACRHGPALGAMRLGVWTGAGRRWATRLPRILLKHRRAAPGRASRAR